MSTTAAIDIETTAAKLAAIPEWQETNRGLIGRRRELSTVVTAIASRRHVILYGLPGVAKSMTVDGVAKHMPDLSKFKTQAYKASPPEQFLGQISFKGIEQDQYKRITAGKAPDSELVIIDETSRAPRSVLPAFQGMMVEREFDSGAGVQSVPLMTFVGTVNSLLEDDTELAAFFDRFALKLNVKPPASQDEFIRILKGAAQRQLSDPDVPDELLVSRDELIAFQQHVPTVHVPDDVYSTIAELWSNLVGVGVMPSIRRYTDVVLVMQAQAAIDGRDEVLIDDVQVCQHSLWTAPSEEATVYAEVVKFASEWVRKTSELMDAFAEILDRFGQVQALVSSGSKSADSVEIAEKTMSITDHSITVLNEQKDLRQKIDRQVADAAGRDTSELDAVLTQMDAAADWVSDRVLGGLRL